MARKRMIDPSFWEDLTIGQLPREARLCFIGLISHADDEGRVEVDPRYVKRAVFGFDDDLTSADVAGIIDTLRATCQNLQFYEAGGRQLAAFRNWKSYQYIQKAQASKLPPPPESDEYDTSTVPVSNASDNSSLSVAPNRIEKNKNRKEGNDARAETIVGSLIDIGLLRVQAINIVKQNPSLDIACVDRWRRFVSTSHAQNPVGLMVAYLKEGRTEPPNGKINGVRAAPQEELTMAEIERRAAALEADDETDNEHTVAADAT